MPEPIVDPSNPAPVEPAAPAPSEPPAERTFTEAEHKAAVEKAIKERFSKYADYDAIKEKAEKFDQAELDRMDEVERAKAEAQAAREEAERAKADADAMKLDALRTRIAASKGLPPELADRLTGSTEEEITADADKLAALIPKKPTDFGQGGGGSSTKLSPEEAGKLSVADYEKAVEEGRI